SKVSRLHQLRRHLHPSNELPADSLMLRGRKLARVRQGVDRIDCFVAPNRFDARKAERKTAGVTRARLERVKGNLENDLRAHCTIAPAVDNSVAFEMLG